MLELALLQARHGSINLVEVHTLIQRFGRLVGARISVKADDLQPLCGLQAALRPYLSDLSIPHFARQRRPMGTSYCTTFRYEIRMATYLSLFITGLRYLGGMAAEYSIDVKARLVVTILAGIISRDQLLAHMAKLGNDPDFSPTFAELVSVTKGAHINLSYSEIRNMVAADPFSTQSKRAFVVRSPSNYGMIRMFQVARGEEGNVEIFKNPEDAYRWLGV